MPRFDAAATSIVLTPAPARTINDSAPASIIVSVTVVERTTSTGACDCLIAATSESPDASGSKRTSQPAIFNASSPDFSNLSATRTFMSDQMREQSVAQLRLEPRRLRRHDAAGV